MASAKRVRDVRFSYPPKPGKTPVPAPSPRISTRRSACCGGTEASHRNRTTAWRTTSRRSRTLWLPRLPQYMIGGLLPREGACWFAGGRIVPGSLSYPIIEENTTVSPLQA